ncbi:hypothetical protein LTR27_013017 [Elasticomyces elasticus]|nr:hypothetical protein LTR27_013017 [Elasticomyces elasticus]
MSRLNVTIRIDGQAAKRVYVEHLVLGISSKVYITDDNGEVRDNNGNKGIDSGTPWADIRILAQNSVAKVVEPVPLFGALQQVSLNK